MMSETAFLRLCQDYAISPHLLSTKQCRSIFDATSKPKLIQRGYSLIREKVKRVVVECLAYGLLIVHAYSL
jgi:hypothetical protein